MPWHGRGAGGMGAHPTGGSLVAGPAHLLARGLLGIHNVRYPFVRRSHGARAPGCKNGRTLSQECPFWNFQKVKLRAAQLVRNPKVSPLSCASPGTCPTPLTLSWGQASAGGRDVLVY